MEPKQTNILELEIEVEELEPIRALSDTVFPF